MVAGSLRTSPKGRVLDRISPSITVLGPRCTSLGPRGYRVTDAAGQRIAVAQLGAITPLADRARRALAVDRAWQPATASPRGLGGRWAAARGPP
eukprot:2793268-Alexandrium_andersonii.AAC.1